MLYIEIILFHTLSNLQKSINKYYQKNILHLGSNRPIFYKNNYYKTKINIHTCNIKRTKKYTCPY